MPLLPGTLSIIRNPKSQRTRPYNEAQNAIISLEAAHAVREDIRAWPGYDVTPLHRLASLERQLPLARLWYKDESQRFGLKSFKALGGAYAVGRQLQKVVQAKTGREPNLSDLLQGDYHELLADEVVTCATDGNHGRSVAWGARLFGCHCIIYVHRDVSGGRQAAIEALGAQVVRIDGNYDESVRQADTDARLYERILVSDTSYPGYTDIPKDVALGYTVMVAEIVEQLNGEIPTHVIIQGGVGGFASAVCGYFWALWGEQRPRFSVVEPEQANCLQRSAQAGQRVAVAGALHTLMAGLACGEVSVLAWEILETGVDDFLTLSEDAVPATMQWLARGCEDDPPIEAGESAVPGLAAAILASQTPQWAEALALDASSRVLVIGTEGATDPELYHRLIRDSVNAGLA
ncbi:MAG: diaminopropionate ammonia-lyase [Saccharospirillum sp.]